MKCLINKVSDLFKYRKQKILNLVFFLISFLIILYSFFLLFNASGGIIRFASGAAFFLVKIVVRFSFFLVLNTIPFIFPPAVFYLAACLFLKKRYLRYYIFLILFSLYIIWFIKVILKADFFIIGHILKLDEILTALVQIYIFTSLIMPDFMSTLISSVFFIVKSFLVFILPDLPFRYDDFGLIIALFLFTFLYLNTIVLLIKKVGKLLQKINLSEISFGSSGGGSGGKNKR